MEYVMNQVLNLVAPLVACLIIWVTMFSFGALKRFHSILTWLFLREDIAGKVILITGASSGIGEELAYEYARKGACLVLAARRDDLMRDVAGRCLYLGSPDTIFIRTDVSNPDHCELAVNAAINHFGNLDHLVNNAGIVSANLFEDCNDVTNLRPVMGINLWGSVYMTRFAIPHLRRSKGKITVISSATSWLPVPRMSFYNASKAAMVAFFEALRIEVWPDVTITIATPGYVESEMTQGKYLSKDGQMKVDQQLRDAQVGLIPVCNARDVAKAIVSGTRQGMRLVIKPDWIRLTRVMKILCPEIMDWVFWWFYVTKPSSPPREAATKRFTGPSPPRVIQP